MMPAKIITIGNTIVVGPEMETMWVAISGGKAPVAGGNGGKIWGRANLTPGEIIYTNSDNGCNGGANGTGGPGAGRAGGGTAWIGRTSSTKANCFLIAGGGGGRVGGGATGGGPGGHTLDTEATGQSNCSAGQAGNIGAGGGGGGGRGWRGGAGGGPAGGANGNGDGGTNMYRTTVVDAATVVSESGTATSSTVAMAIYWSRTLLGLVYDYPGVGFPTEIAACGAMI